MANRIYKHPVHVRFSLGDHARIMFFGSSYILAHEVLEDFILSIGFEWDDYFDRSDWGMPYRHSEATFSKPALPGETLEAHLDVERMGNSSVVYRVRCFDSAGDETFVVRMVAVCVCRKRHVTQPVPDLLRDRLLPYLAAGD